MADLSSILTDPNYVNANAATKQAIFDKFSATDTNFTGANPATQDAIRVKFGLGSTPAAPSGGVPVGRSSPGMLDFLSAPFEMGQALASKPRAEQAAFIAPTVEALGAAGGGLMGAPLGPVGAVAGAGAGYAGAKGLMRLIGGTNVAEPVSRTAQRVASDVAEGATMEIGGQLAGKALGYAAGKIADLRQIPAQKAATIARNALGPDMPEVLNALKSSQGQNVTAGQAVADINSPTFQALMDRAVSRDPRFMEALKASQGEVSLNALAKLAGGVSAAETRAATEVAKKNLNTVTSPVREAALNRANLGKAVSGLETEAQQLAAQATGKVQDVRRLTELGARAETASATVPLRSTSGERIGMPLLPGRYTYPGELAKKADEWASQAANASLDLGQGSRFAQSAADAMRSSGIKPLEGVTLAQNISSVANKPEFAGNDLLAGAAKNVAQDIAKWTNGGGVVDAKALDAIRKNSVNAAIQQLRPGADASTQRNLAAGVLSKIKPAIDDAIEASGGEGYKQYLANYSKGMQRISEQKLTGEALNLWKTNKDAFVKLVQNESPDVVEKILGPGNYNIAKEVSENTLSVLEAQAAKAIRDVKITGQAAVGQDALREILSDQISKLRIPSFLNKVATTTNAALNILENKIGRATMNALTEAAKTPGGAVKLLETLPANERVRVIQLLSNPQQWKPGAGAVAGIAATNMLAPESPNRNALIGQ